MASMPPMLMKPSFGLGITRWRLSSALRCRGSQCLGDSSSAHLLNHFGKSVPAMIIVGVHGLCTAQTADERSYEPPAPSLPPPMPWPRSPACPNTRDQCCHLQSKRHDPARKRDHGIACPTRLRLLCKTSNRRHGLSSGNGGPFSSRGPTQFVVQV